jgi:hypothetical protein
LTFTACAGQQQQSNRRRRFGGSGLGRFPTHKSGSVGVESATVAVRSVRPLSRGGRNRGERRGLKGSASMAKARV